jgi:hypothetical protein
MNEIIQPFLSQNNNITVCYIDDVLIATTGIKEEHHKYVRKILQVLQDNELVVEIYKCNVKGSGLGVLGVIKQKAGGLKEMGIACS